MLHDLVTQKENIKAFEGFAVQKIRSLFPVEITDHGLLEAVMYSFSSGGKRFRPALTLAAAEAFGLDVRSVFPWALAIEMIHTYSLIHDDLPCMDNDDFRRGKPTNHKVYGESTALLAGDALLTEAFGILASHYSETNSETKSKSVLSCLILELVQVGGLKGMIGGQYLDMKSLGGDLSSLTLMHNLKTGALISACLSGPAMLANLNQEQQQKAKQMGLEIGFLFQAKDDILDAHEINQESKSIIPLLGGAEKTQQYIEKKSKQLILEIDKLLSEVSPSVENKQKLQTFINWNLDRGR